MLAWESLSEVLVEIAWRERSRKKTGDKMDGMQKKFLLCFTASFGSYWSRITLKFLIFKNLFYSLEIKTDLKIITALH